MIGTCSRCNREDRIENRKKNWCMNCVNSYKQHQRIINNKISESERERRKKTFKKWYKNNRKKCSIYSRNNYRRNKKEWNSRSATQKVRRTILKAFNNQCFQCHSKDNLEIDHLKYEIKKSELLKCVRVLCRNCHRKTHRLYNIKNRMKML